MQSLSLLFLLALFTCYVAILDATPSTTYWTPCTTDIQPEGVLHPGVDNYFTVFNRRGEGEFFPPDVGLTYGVFNLCNLGAEAGIDYLGGADDPVYFNAKIGVAEGKLFSNAPAVNVGVFNVGTRWSGPNKTNQNIVDIIFGKSLPKYIGGTIYIAAFSGNRAMGKDRQGFMIAFQRGFNPAKYCDGREYHKWVLAADYASGKNTIGGGGVGVYYYFTPDISLLTGPVFFNDAHLNGRWKWTVQLDINVPVTRQARASTAAHLGELSKTKKENNQKASNNGNSRKLSETNNILEAPSIVRSNESFHNMEFYVYLTLLENYLYHSDSSSIRSGLSYIRS